MARISTDGKHLEVIPTPRRQNPTAAEINQWQQEKVEQDQRVKKAEKDFTYTGKYLNAKSGIASSAKQSFLDYQTSIEEDEKKLARLEQDYNMIPTPELRRECDELKANIERQKGTLTFYEKTSRDFEGSQKTLQQQYQNDQQTQQKALEDRDLFHQAYVNILESYLGDDMDELSQDALGTVLPYQELVHGYMGNYLNEELEKAEKELAKLSLYEVGIPRETLQFKIAELKTELFQLEGEKYRHQKKKEALSDPDFQKYVEMGKEMEKSLYHDIVFNQACMVKSNGIIPLNTTFPFEDRKAMETIDQKMYYYFRGKGDSKSAKEYQDSLQRQINETRNDEYIAGLQKSAEEDPLGAGLASAIPNLYAAGLTLGDMLEAATLPEEQKGLLADPNTPGQSMTRGTQVMREPGLESIKNPGLRKAMEYLYAGADMIPAIALDWAGAPGLGTAYRGILRGTRGYADKTAQGATVEDALQWAKANAAAAMFLGNSSRGTGNGVNGEIPQQPGIVSQQGASLDLANPSLPGASSGSPFSTISNVLGEQGAFQYLLGKNGYSLNNILAKPSAQQAYTLLRASGLEQSRAQQLLENNGYSAKNLTEPPASTLPPFSTGELRKLLNEPGLDVESTKRLMEREGYTSELPNLLEGDEQKLLRLDTSQNMKYNDTAVWGGFDPIAKDTNYLQNKLNYVWNGEKSFIPEQAKFEKITTMAGAGTPTLIRDIARLVNSYGSSADKWKKQSGKIVSSKYVFDLHWYEADDGIQHDVKLKWRSEKK